MTDTSIRFLLNNDVKSVADYNPNTSLLQYLRDSEAKCGTKEGCASGDCGACTVAVAELESPTGTALRYKSVNACISLLPSLHGKQVLTVEDLKQGDQLHGCQQAMVDCHASQCGFCTPGFVMSLFALQKNHAAPSREQILEALAGNLCRCTGYNTILDAAKQQFAKQPPEDQFDRNRDHTIRELQALNTVASTQQGDSQHQAYSPASLEELAELLARHPNAKLLAGGTDLALAITQQLQAFDTLIYVGAIPELVHTRDTADTVSIGAALPYCDFSPRLSADYPELGAMIERLGSLQIRNQGTLGGNIGNASPIGDMPPVLIALGATMTLRQGDQTRSLAVQDFFIDYKVTALRQGEFIQSIEIPKPRANHVLKVYKISKRLDDDISAVLGVFHLSIVKGKIETAQLAFGGMAAIPKRAQHCEAALRGQSWNQSTIDSATRALESDFSPLSDARASADYRMQVAKNLLQKCFLEIENPGVQTNVAHFS